MNQVEKRRRDNLLLWQEIGARESECDLEFAQIEALIIESTPHEQSLFALDESSISIPVSPKPIDDNSSPNQLDAEPVILKTRLLKHLFPASTQKDQSKVVERLKQELASRDLTISELSDKNAVSLSPVKLPTETGSQDKGCKKPQADQSIHWRPEKTAGSAG